MSLAVASQPMSGEVRDRKLEHIQLALERRMQLDGRFFDRLFFAHEALPEIDRDSIDLSCEFLGKNLRFPLLVSCMTGGTASAAQINHNLAAAAEAMGIAIGVGSQRAALESPASAETFEVRSVAPNVPLLANLGAVQLNYGFTVDHCRRAVDMIQADGLALHLNPLQEAIQPEGQCNFEGLTAKIGQLVEQLEVPVIVKEIGCGIGQETAQRLADVGVEWIDTAGLGGTSWSRIEGARADDAPLGELFADWGVPTPRSIEAVASVGGLRVIGSGGVRNGIDVAKALALGASVVGLAQPFLRAAMNSVEEVESRIRRIADELRIAMFCVGAADVDAMAEATLEERDSR